MGRVRRVDVGGMVYHGWNRANFRSRLFQTGAHYQDFLAVVEESLHFVPMRAQGNPQVRTVIHKLVAIVDHPRVNDARGRDGHGRN